MVAKDTKGERVPINLGDVFDINAPIVATYYFNSAYGNEVTDETGLSTLYHENVTAAAGTRLGAGTSFRLINSNDISSKLWGDGISQLNKAGELGL